MQHYRKALTFTKNRKTKKNKKNSWCELIYDTWYQDNMIRNDIWMTIYGDNWMKTCIFMLCTIIFNLLLINIRWWCVLYTRQKNAELHFMELNSLKQQFSCRHVIPLWHYADQSLILPLMEKKQLQCSTWSDRGSIYDIAHSRRARK